MLNSSTQYNLCDFVHGPISNLFILYSVSQKFFWKEYGCSEIRHDIRRGKLLNLVPPECRRIL